jgi:hypothetical protein
VRGCADALVRALDHVPPNRRRTWASRLFVGSLIGWALCHIGLLLLPPWFFEHVLLAISWAAISLTAIDVLSTTDVRASEDGDDERHG